MSHSNGPDIDNTKALAEMVATEMSIFAHPMLRHHPNIQQLERLSWGITAERCKEHVLPAPVIEKTKYGDLSTFADSSLGKSLAFEKRLRLCVDTARAPQGMRLCSK